MRNGRERPRARGGRGRARLVEEDLLHDERRDGLGKLRAHLHRAEAEGDDLRAEEEVRHLRVVNLARGRRGSEAVAQRGPLRTSEGLRSEGGEPARTFTSAPMTPRLVSRRYSNGRVLDTVFRNG